MPVRVCDHPRHATGHEHVFRWKWAEKNKGNEPKLPKHVGFLICSHRRIQRTKFESKSFRSSENEPKLGLSWGHIHTKTYIFAENEQKKWWNVPKSAGNTFHRICMGYSYPIKKSLTKKHVSTRRKPKYSKNFLLSHANLNALREKKSGKHILPFFKSLNFFLMCYLDPK